MRRRPIHQVSLGTCHDIRHWVACADCTGMGDKRHMIEVDGDQLHRVCFKRAHGISAVLKLPAAQRGMFTLSELGVAGARRVLASLRESER